MTQDQAAKIASYPRGSELWKKSREGRITASNFHRAVGDRNDAFVKEQLWGTAFKGIRVTKHVNESEAKAEDAHKSSVVQCLNLTDVSKVEIEQRGPFAPLENRGWVLALIEL